MNVLVTGATGLLGNNLVREMLQSGLSPICLVRPGFDPRALEGLRIPVVCGDWDDESFLKEVVARSDAIVHSAAMLHIGWRNVEQSIEVNAGLTGRFAKLARQRGIRLVHVSTVDALAASTADQPMTETAIEPAKPACAYVLSKRLAETEVLREVSAGLDGVIVNPGFMVGPWDWKPSSGKMMLALRQQYLPLAPAGGCSVVDVRDVCQGITAALARGRTGERYILGGHNTTYFDLWRSMSTVVGRRPPLGRLAAPITWFAGGAGDLAARVTGREGLLNSAAVRMGQMFHYYSSEKAGRELNYSIRPYEQGLEDAWQWFVENGYARLRNARFNG